MRLALSYDDIRIIPGYSDIKSRSFVDPGTCLDEKRDIWLDTPIVARPMQTICGEEMASKMEDLGGLGIVHRFMPIEQQIRILKALDEAGKVLCAAAVGVKEEGKERYVRLINEANIKLVLIDVAHGHHILVKEMVDFIRSLGYDIHIMAGNIATPSAVKDMAS